MAKNFDISKTQLRTILNDQRNKRQQTNSPSKEVIKSDASYAQLLPILNPQQNKKEQANSPSDEKRDSYIEFFNTHLFEHLKKEHDPNGNKNQPSTIIDKARNSPSSIGALSRIFDEYDCPTPNYEEINTIYQKPNGLREHIQEKLNGIIPVLLNEDRTALHPDVIEAIGQENYNAILNNAQDDKRAIAEQFVKAVISGYGQRILQNTDDNDLKLKLYTSVLPALEMLNKEVTLQGLPEQSKPIPAVILTNISSDFINLLEAAEKDGIKSKLFGDAKSELDSVVARFNDKHEDHTGYMHESEEVKNAKGLESYNKAVDFVIRGITDSLADEPPKPKEVSWFKKFLRFITCNEKLLQNADEKAHDRYEKQRDRLLTLIPKINKLNSQLMSYAKDEHQVTQDCRNETPITFRHQ
ncbi:TPA: hypothetical protein I8Z88_001387 [Legionella pneumophila]|nr:hypothetical protein [Legionella pneumophila]